MFTMLSPANHVKSETIITIECDGIRERHPHERIHLREAGNDANTICVKCGKRALVWYDSQDKWEAHNMRCVA